MLKHATFTDGRNPVGGVLTITDCERIRISHWNRRDALNSLSGDHRTVVGYRNGTVGVLR